MVPGQVLTQESIDFMRQLDVKEIHGYEKAKGLKLLKPDAIMPQRDAAAVSAAGKRARVSARGSTRASRIEGWLGSGIGVRHH